MLAVETLTASETAVPRGTVFADPARTHAVTLLTRLAQRREEGKPLLEAMLTGRLADLIDPALDVATETGEPLGTALAQCFAREGSDELAEWLAVRLAGAPYASVWPLHDLALRATQRFLEVCRQTWTSPGPRERGILAGLVHNQGRRLVTLGRAAEALSLLEEALSLYAELGPERQSSRLQCLGICSEALLTQLGRLSEALSLAEEAAAASKTEIREADGEQTVNLHLALAGHLINLCGCLADVDRHGDALAVIEEAVALYRRHRWEGQAPAYARALLCRGNELYHLGRYEEAAESLEEAIALSRDLETDRTTAFEPDLALALADLSLLYEETGHTERAREAGRVKEAVAATRKSIKLYRKLLAWRPEATAGLAASLSNLAPRLSELGQPAKALRHAEEAVKLYRREDDDPEGVATALHSLGTSLLDLERPAEAMPHLEEAVAMRSQLAASQPKIHDVDLACSLVSLGKSLSDQGRYRKALPKARRGVRLLRRAIKRGGDFLRPWLAATLSNQSHQLRELGEPKAALKVAEEAVQLLTPFVLENPEHYRNWITAAVGNYLGAAGEAGVEPDMGKVAEIITALARAGE